jgi:hypothetical protein
MMRHTLAPLVMVLLAACSGDKAKQTAQAPAPPVQDTTPMNLDSIKSAIPPAAPDTFKPPKPPPMAKPIPPAPPALVSVVEREESFTKFCYQEFGQKADPTLRGGVAMVVTVGREGISETKVAADTWSSKAGKSVNSCLEERAPRAWKPAAGTVKPGKYVVQLSFKPA